MGGVDKLLGHLWVHRDHQLSFLRHQSIAFLDLLAHPLLEWSAEHGSNDVDQPLFGRLGEVDLVGQVVRDIRVVADELHNLLQGQVLIHRHMEVLDAVVLEMPLLLVQNVFEEVDGDVVCSNTKMSLCRRYLLLVEYLKAEAPFGRKGQMLKHLP